VGGVGWDGMEREKGEGNGSGMEIFNF